MLTGLFEVCAKQNCSSVSHWVYIILTMHIIVCTCQNICDSFFLSKSTERVLMLLFCVFSEPTGYISLFGVSY